MYIYVQDKEGNPLMPCRKPGKVCHMLKDGRAVIVSYEPFTIRLTYEPEHKYVEKVILGVDTGSKYVGLSAASDENEYFCAEAQIRSVEIKKLLDEKRGCRRQRRTSKLRYRKPRFMNRVSSKKPGWLPPSVTAKMTSHVQLIKLVEKILPIAEIVIEKGKFDTHKLKNPDVSGSDYQHGKKEGFENSKAFVKYRDNYKCVCCKKKSAKNRKLEVHHILYINDGGSDDPDNLVTLCHQCHEKIHKNKLKLPRKFNARSKTAKFLRDAAFMNAMSDKLVELVRAEFPHVTVKTTYGYITKTKREKMGLLKRHSNDALAITGNLSAKPYSRLVRIKRVRRHNRKIFNVRIFKKGVRKRNQSDVKFIGGFLRWDKVLIKETGVTGFITGRMKKEKHAVVCNMDGEKLHEKSTIAMWKIKLLKHANGMLYEETNI